MIMDDVVLALESVFSFFLSHPIKVNKMIEAGMKYLLIIVLNLSIYTDSFYYQEQD